MVSLARGNDWANETLEGYAGASLLWTENHRKRCSWLGWIGFSYLGQKASQLFNNFKKCTGWRFWPPSINVFMNKWTISIKPMILWRILAFLYLERLLTLTVCGISREAHVEERRLRNSSHWRDSRHSHITDQTQEMRNILLLSYLPCQKPPSQ